MGFRGAAPSGMGPQGAAPWGFEGQHHGVSRHSTMGFQGAATWGFEGQQQVGWDLKGELRGGEVKQLSFIYATIQVEL